MKVPSWSIETPPSTSMSAICVDCMWNEREENDGEIKNGKGKENCKSFG